MASKLMNKLRGKRPKASPQPQTQAASQSASPVPSSSIPEPQTLPARLWCQAYDELKLSHRKEVEAYEKILSTQLDQKRQSSTGALVQAVGNIIGQTHETRWRQMEELVQAGLERTRKEAAIKQGIDDKLQTVSAIKEIADKAVRAVPEAAIAWVGVCSGLEMLSNAVTAPGTNRQGMTYVISRMAWYWDLATLLLDENMAERSIKLRDELESHIVQLYQKLLLYQIRSICLYYRNQASIVLQDVIKVHDWTSQLKDIKDAEVAVKSDAEQYNTEQIKSRLDKLATVAQSREMKLQAIHASMQEQASSYEKRQQDSKDNECLRDLYVTNPGEDKERIEKTKGGLLKESYKWILSNKDFENWRNDEQSRLLWIKGDPGKGKTMLLCGIIDEIKDAMSKGEPEAPNLMAYFFCQTTDSRINNAISVLRSLIWMLVEQCESLISHVRKEYDNRGKALFEGPNAWVALSRILDKMLQDQCVGKVYIMIDALDECSTDLQDLLRLIVDKSCASSRFKWIVSSRNWPNIEQQLEVAAQKVRLCLELNQESISAAVKVYIHHEVERLAMIKDYDVATRNAVEHGLSSKASDTFLWVSLVCRELADPDVMLWDTLKTLSTFPPGLDSLYKRMLHQIIGSKNADVCKQMLAVASVVYRPLTLRELSCLVEMPQTVKDDVQLLEKMMKLCGSFLTLQEDIVYFVHQSAKDFVLQTAHHHLFPHGKQHTHGTMLSKSLDIMSRTLRADLYSLRSPGFPIEQVTQPEPDPLATARYSCVYWIDHLCDWDCSESAAQTEKTLDRSDSIMCNYGAQVLGFVRKHLLHWFESLSLMGKLPEGILSISRLESKLAANSNDELYAFMYDAKRFILSHRAIIEKAPLQLYSSALIFTPQRSIVRRQFETDLPEWILRAPTVSKQWSPLLQALETGSRTSDIKFSPDNKLLAAATYGNIRLWDVETGVSLHILDAFPKDSDSRPRDVTSLAFTSDGKLLSLLEVWLQDSGYWRLEYCMAWDIATGAGTRVDIGQTAHESSKFKDSEYFSLSPDGKCIVACGGPQQGNTIHLWDIEAGAPPKALVGHSAPINNFSVSPDGKFIVSSSDDGIIKLWDSVSGAILHDLKGPLEHNSILSVATSGQLVASMDSEASSYVWDAATGNIIWEKKHVGEPHYFSEVAIAPNNKLVAYATEYSSGNQILTKCVIWDVDSDTIKQTIEPSTLHSCGDNLVFSHDSRLLALDSLQGYIHLYATMDDTLDTSMDRSYAKTGGELPHYMIASNGRQIVLYQYVEDGGTTQILDISKGAITSIIDDALSPWSCRPRFSANGQMLAVARENSITIRDVSTGTILSTLGHKLVDIECVACSPNGSLAAFSGFDPNQLVSSVKLCNIAAGTRRDWEHSSATAVSPNVDLVAYATKDNKIELRDTSGTTVLRTLEGHNSTIRILVFSLDGKLITSASDQETGGSIMIWDRVTGTALHSLQGHSKRIHTLVFAPHGQTLASASQDQTVRLWGVTNGLALQVLHHTRPINIIAFSSDGTVLASSDSGSEVTLWDVASGAILRKLQGSRIVFDFWPNSSLIASVSASDGTISIWNTATDDKPRIIQADSDSFSVVIFSPDGKLMASASGHDSVIKLWDTATGVTLHNFKSNSSIIMRRHYAIRLWDVATGAVVRDLQSESGVLFIHTMAFSPDEKVIAAGFNTLGLLAWDTETGTLLEGIHPPGWEKYDIHSTGAKICISFSPDGVNLAVTLSRPTKQICLWDTSTGMSLAQFRTRPSDSDKRVDNLAISPDTMSKLVASSSENVITVWDGVRGDALTLEGHSGDIASISFSPDGGVLASSSLDATIRLWDVKSAKMLHILEAHDSGVENVVFSHNGKLLASASIDEVVKLWNPETGMCLGSIHAQCSLKQLAFSQRGPYLETERGVLDFGHIVGSVSETESKRPSNLYIRGNWITWDMKNLIWLPPGYRQVHPSCEGNVVTFLDIKGGEPITFLELGPRGTNVAANCQEVDQDDC